VLLTKTLRAIVDASYEFRHLVGPVTQPKVLNASLNAHTFANKLSQRQQKSRAWLILIISTLTLICMSTLFLGFDLYRFLIQIHSIMFSFEPGLENRMASIQPQVVLAIFLQNVVYIAAVCVHSGAYRS
jgi:hypothetical protein